MDNVAFIRRHCRSGQNIKTDPIRVINLEANRIPEPRYVLPFVYQARLRTYQQLVDVDLSHGQILIARLGVTHIK